MRRHGFTLIELLLTMGIIGILASIVIFAVNPSKQFISGRDTERRHVVNQMQKAMYQYYIDESEMPGDKEIQEGESNAIDICQETVTDADCVNLDDLTTDYIATISVDPVETSTIVTGYRAYMRVGRPRVLAVYMGDIGDALLDYTARLGFEELAGATTFVDRSGNGMDGSCTPAGKCPTAGVTGVAGYALDFDGADDYIEIPDSDYVDFDKDEDFSISMWVKIPATQDDTYSTQNTIVEKWNNNNPDGFPYAIRVYNQTHANNGKIVALRYDGAKVPAVISSTLCNDDAWHHIVFLKDSSTIKLYIDGTMEDDDTDDTTNSTTNDASLWIGKRGDYIFNFKGLVDDFRIYDRTLTEDEVTELAGG